MISVKELRIGNLVKDENDNIWRIGCITNMYKDDSSLILERRIDNGMIKWYDNGVIKWYDNKYNVYPIRLNDRMLDQMGFDDRDEYDCRHKKEIAIYKNNEGEYILDTGVYVEYRDTGVYIKSLHHLQNMAYDLYGISLDLNIFDDDYPGDASFV